jgi:peptidoglycan/xylan/chitin deacetylase (PgdA/CDA1 family)
MATNIPKSIKQATLASLRRAGMFSLVAQSRWRRRRLLIVCYHGISLDDEHEWDPRLYIEPALFEERLKILSRANVLPLSEGLARLINGTLPEMSAVITVDDGTYDFYARGWPLLEKYGLPATVYLTTYYSEYNRPVFRLICSYMLWKKRGEIIRSPIIPGWDGPLDLRTGAGLEQALAALDHYAKSKSLSASQKDELASQLARQLGIDYEDLVSRRILQVMTPDETRKLAAAGCDIQLHTHRHRTPDDKALFASEITENRVRVEERSNRRAVHFCYPSGVTAPEFLPWLRELGVESATTCAAGLATAGTEPLLLPRLVDHKGLHEVEFEGWMAGLGAWLPQRQYSAVDPEKEL